MSSLNPRFHADQRAVSLQIPQEKDFARPAASQRAVSIMRKFEVQALLSNDTLSMNSMVAPATPLFEDAATAFARGTLMPTPQGPIAVEDLVPGDCLTTQDGPLPVIWIGSTLYVPGRDDAGTSLTSLTRITADACGFGRPSMDLLVGPAARRVIRHERLQRLLGQEAVLAPMSDYVDGDRFLDVTPAGAVQMYHVMLQRHATLEIGGIELETYHPGKAVQQIAGDNMRALFLSMFANIDSVEEFGSLRFPRTTREVIESLLDT